MTGRTCPGCGRRVVGDFVVCVACGSDVPTLSAAGEVTGGAVVLPPLALPPPPVVAAQAVWAPPSNAVAPVSTGEQLVRNLAAVSLAAVALLYWFAAFVGLLAFSDADADSASGTAGALLGVAVSGLIGMMLVGLAARILRHPDRRAFVAAAGWCFFATMLFGAQAIDAGLTPLAVTFALVPVVALMFALLALRLSPSER
jgi:hypothetical protein